MKILLFTGHGGITLNEDLKQILNDGIEGRIKAVEYLEKNSIQKSENYCDYIKQLKNNIVKINENMYATENSYNGTTCFYSIVDVDINKKWLIEEYDNSEYIKYLDFEVINEKYNYCRWCD